MGGSGGGYYTSRELEQLLEEARTRLDQTRIDADVNDLLQSELATINDRDAETINSRLGEIAEVLEEDGLDIERIIYGGSITKHTYVDGISDVDSLVLLDDTSADLTPEQAKNKVHGAIVARLSQGDVAEVQVGNLAVTVTYRDGTVVQLLPAVRSGDGFAIASANGQTWSHIEPRKFHQSLTAANARQGSALVPAIKLAKAILEHRLGDERPSGYHVETLAIAAFADYEGPRTPKAMVTRFLRAASDRVLTPLPDISGQSTFVDESLGPSNSADRTTLSHRLAALADTAERATSIEQWRALLG